MKDVEKSREDKIRDKKKGYKEGSKEDKALDAKQLARMKKAYDKKK